MHLNFRYENVYLRTSEILFISILNYILTTHQDKLNGLWLNSIAKSQCSPSKILMLSWLHPTSEYFSPSFHVVNTCKYNSVSPKIKRILIYWVSSRLEIIWEERLGKNSETFELKQEKVAAGIITSFLVQNLVKGQKVKNRVCAPVCLLGRSLHILYR